MVDPLELGAWDGAIDVPETRRSAKPRAQGITMLIDKGLGLRATRDLLELASGCIDFIKIAFGSSALYPTTLLQEKIDLIKSYDIEVYPGGTLFEIAAYQGKLKQLFQRGRELGFTYFEVSEGTIDLPPAQRAKCIAQCQEEGFGVLSEVGKKDRNHTLDPKQAVDQIALDLAQGSERVIIEGRDSGEGVGIYGSEGEIQDDLLNAILDGVPNSNRLIIEAPKTSQQNALLTKLGPNVNLGNVQPEDALTLESTRCGLRGDTLRNCLQNQA